jgi:hypothetical protein
MEKHRFVTKGVQPFLALENALDRWVLCDPEFDTGKRDGLEDREQPSGFGFALFYVHALRP